MSAKTLALAGAHTERNTSDISDLKSSLKELETRLSSDIDKSEKNLNSSIDKSEKNLNSSIDKSEKRLRSDILGLDSRLKEIKSIIIMVAIAAGGLLFTSGFKITSKIDNVNNNLTSKIDGVNNTLQAKIDKTSRPEAKGINNNPNAPSRERDAPTKKEIQKLINLLKNRSK